MQFKDELQEILTLYFLHLFYKQKMPNAYVSNLLFRQGKQGGKFTSLMMHQTWFLLEFSRKTEVIPNAAVRKLCNMSNIT